MQKQAQEPLAKRNQWRRLKHLTRVCSGNKGGREGQEGPDSRRGICSRHQVKHHMRSFGNDLSYPQ